MTEYFEEKSQQVLPGSFVAFGIDITSRYSKAWEIIEMINFSRIVAQHGIAHYVKSVFYDSKANICSFELVESVKQGDPVAELLSQAAQESLSQFELFGYVGHGEPLDDLFSTEQP